MDEATAAMLTEILSQTVETKLLVRALIDKEETEEECCEPEAEHTAMPSIESDMLEDLAFDFDSEYFY
jgi:hypothetical protein